MKEKGGETMCLKVSGRINQALLLEFWREAGVSKNEDQTGKQDQLYYKYPFSV